MYKICIYFLDSFGFFRIVLFHHYPLCQPNHVSKAFLLSLWLFIITVTRLHILTGWKKNAGSPADGQKGKMTTLKGRFFRTTSARYNKQMRLSLIFSRISCILIAKIFNIGRFYISLFKKFHLFFHNLLLKNIQWYYSKL